MTPFEIVLIPFPFADLSATKRRPCLVLSSFRPRSLGEHVIVAMITSQVRAPLFPHDVMLQDWQKAGLPLESLVRLSKVVTIESSLVVKSLGKLTKPDRNKITTEFRKLFHEFV